MRESGGRGGSGQGDAATGQGTPGASGRWKWRKAPAPEPGRSTAPFGTCGLRDGETHRLSGPPAGCTFPQPAPGRPRVPCPLGQPAPGAVFGRKQSDACAGGLGTLRGLLAIWSPAPRRSVGAPGRVCASPPVFSLPSALAHAVRVTAGPVRAECPFPGAVLGGLPPAASDRPRAPGSRPALHTRLPPSPAPSLPPGGELVGLAARRAAGDRATILFTGGGGLESCWQEVGVPEAPGDEWPGGELLLRPWAALRPPEPWVWRGHMAAHCGGRTWPRCCACCPPTPSRPHPHSLPCLGSGRSSEASYLLCPPRPPPYLPDGA